RIFYLAGGREALPRWWETNFLNLVHLLSYDASPFGVDLARRFRELCEPTPQDLATPENMKNSPESLKQVWRENEAAVHKLAELDEVENWMRSLETWRLYHEAADMFPHKNAAWPNCFWVNGDYRW